MTGNGKRWTRAVRFQAMAALGAVVLVGCGSGATKTASGSPTTAAPAQGKGRPAPGTTAFAIGDNCTRAVSDGKDFLAVGCPGSISRLDPAAGKPRWSVADPTWTKIDRIRLGGDVVVAQVTVTVPAAGLNAKQEGYQVVALAEGKKIWSTDLIPSSESPPEFATSPEVTVVAQAGGHFRATFDATVIGMDTKSGRQRFRKVVDPAKCGGDYTQPLILRDSVAACSQRFGLGDGSMLPYTRPLNGLADPKDDSGADAASDLAVGWDQGNQGDNGFAIFRSDGQPIGKAKGEFLGFAAGAVVNAQVDYFNNDKDTVRSVQALNSDGSTRWRQTVPLKADVSFANGAAWVRNQSDELIAIDGATGKTAPAILASAAGLGSEAEVLATTTNVLVVKSGGGSSGSPVLRAIAR